MRPPHSTISSPVSSRKVASRLAHEAGLASGLPTLYYTKVSANLFSLHNFTSLYNFTLYNNSLYGTHGKPSSNSKASRVVVWTL